MRSHGHLAGQFNTQGGVNIHSNIRLQTYPGFRETIFLQQILSQYLKITFRPFLQWTCSPILQHSHFLYVECAVVRTIPKLYFFLMYRALFIRLSIREPFHNSTLYIKKIQRLKRQFDTMYTIICTSVAKSLSFSHTN